MVVIGGFATAQSHYEEFLKYHKSCDTIKQLDPEMITIILGVIIYEFRRNDKFKGQMPKKEFKKFADAVAINSFTKRAFNMKNLEKLYFFVKSWYNEMSFLELLDITSYNEGSIIRFFRQIIDLIEQIKKASEDKEFQHKLDYIKTKIDREFVAVVF